MDEIKIWTIDGSDVQEIQPTNQTESERWLEENIVSKPELLMPGLTLVGRQTQTEGGPLDLLGVDSDGRLVLFELKRGTLSRDAVAQIVDYASYLEDMSLDALVKHIADNSGAHGIDKIEDFEEWYAENSDADSLDNLTPLRLFLVGLGVDDRTERMVNFLADKGVDISLLTFYGFMQEGKTLLARQMSVRADDEADSGSGRGNLSKDERWEFLVNHAKRSDVHNLFMEVIKMFHENWHGSTERIFKYRMSYRLRNPSNNKLVNYARIDPEPGQVRIVFFPPAIELCKDAFKPILEEIHYETWPQNRESEVLERNDTEIQFPLTADKWDIYKENLNRLTQSIHASHNK